MSEAPSSRLKFLGVETFGEGMASWHHSVSELLVLSAVLKVSFVEPCVAKGKLSMKNCALGGAPLRTVFDIEVMRSISPKIVPYADYANESLQRESLCMYHYTHGCGILPTIHSSNETCPAALANRDVDAIEFLEYRREGLEGIDLDTLKEANEKLAFAPAHFAIANLIVGALGFDADEHDYVAYQWRSELHHKNATQCAKALIASKDFLVKGNQTVVLVTDLTDVRAHQWGGIRDYDDDVMKQVLKSYTTATSENLF